MGWTCFSFPSEAARPQALFKHDASVANFTKLGPSPRIIITGHHHGLFSRRKQRPPWQIFLLARQSSRAPVYPRRISACTASASHACCTM